MELTDRLTWMLCLTILCLILIFRNSWEKSRSRLGQPYRKFATSLIGAMLITLGLATISLIITFDLAPIMFGFFPALSNSEPVTILTYMFVLNVVFSLLAITFVVITEFTKLWMIHSSSFSPRY